MPAPKPGERGYDEYAATLAATGEYAQAARTAASSAGTTSRAGRATYDEGALKPLRERTPVGTPAAYDPGLQLRSGSHKEVWQPSFQPVTRSSLDEAQLPFASEPAQPSALTRDREKWSEVGYGRWSPAADEPHKGSSAAAVVGRGAGTRVDAARIYTNPKGRSHTIAEILYEQMHGGLTAEVSDLILRQAEAYAVREGGTKMHRLGDKLGDYANYAVYREESRARQAILPERLD